MSFRSKSGHTSIILRLKDHETKNMGIKRLSFDGWIFPDDWAEVEVRKDKMGEFLVMREDAAQMSGDSKELHAKEGRVSGSKFHSDDDYNKYRDGEHRKFERSERVRRFRDENDLKKEKVAFFKKKLRSTTEEAEPEEDSDEKSKEEEE